MNAGLIVLICLVESSNAFELLNWPRGDVWVPEGKSIDLTCEIDESWQWCYWRREAKDGGEEKKFAIFKSHPKKEQLYEEYGVTFAVTNRTCGLHIDSVDDDLHGGQWKCHVADTDLTASNNTVESPYFLLNVATKSSFDFEQSRDLNKVLLHTNVELVCSGNETAAPQPFLSLWVAFPYPPHLQLTNSSVSDNPWELYYEYNLEMQDDGARFYCLIEQKSEEAVLFEDRIDSDAIDLVYGPMLDIQSHADYIFVNESIILPLTFRAKPVPSIEGITWQILNGDVIQIMQGGDEDELFAASVVEKLGEDSNTFRVYLIVKNISNDITVNVSVRNEFGDLKQEMTVNYLPPLRIEEAETLGFPYWILGLLIGLLIVLLVLCAIYFHCSRKKVRREERTRRFQENLTKYIDGVQQSGNKHFVDLDAVPDENDDGQSLPMLKDANMSSPQVMTSNVTRTASEASSIVDEACEHDDTLTYVNLPPKVTVSQTTTEFKQTSSATFKSISVAKMEFDNGLLRSTFKPEEVNLSLRRPRAPTLKVDTTSHNTLPSSRSGDFLRLGGITQFPVISPVPAGYTPSPNPPGRKTSFINYANPKEL